MKYITLVFIFGYLFIGCNDNEIEYAEVVVNKFYNKMEQKNYKAIDSLISFRFYQTTSNKDFIKILSEKNKEFGKLEKKSLGKYKLIKSFTDTVHLGYIVDYEKALSKESFTLIKENGNFKILKYYINKEN